MRSMSLLCAAVCLLVAVSHAAPAPATLEAAETPAMAPQNDQEVIEIVNLSGFGQSDRDKRDINMLRQLFPGLAQDSENNEDNSLSGSESQNNEVRVKFDDQDQDTAASNNGPSPAEEPIVDDDADRNKRFLPFGGTGHAGASAGGSGNFLFDIIRNTADSAARAAGTVYRMVAGTESLGLGLTATSTSTKTVAPAAPIAQMWMLAKALTVTLKEFPDLSQDFSSLPIARLAQTSERIVNFKARLVTALI
ncbi:hypothetical protein CBL_01918 [Carabus blaptoides fortunei]